MFEWTELFVNLISREGREDILKMLKHFIKMFFREILKCSVLSLCHWLKMKSRERKERLH